MEIWSDMLTYILAWRMSCTEYTCSFWVADIPDFRSTLA